MNAKGTGAVALFVTVLGVAAGCALNESDGAESGESAVREQERRALGKAVDYPADTYSAEDEEPVIVIIAIRAIVHRRQNKWGTSGSSRVKIHP
jgi:hypothetical protein